MQENSLLKQTSSQHELRQIRRSSVAMRSAHRRHKIMYKNTECKLKKENALLIKKVNELESANDLLLSERSQLVERDEPKCISSKDGKKECNLACRKAIYYCLEYNVPINSVCPTIRAVLKELADIPVDFLPDPSTVSYFTYELGIMSDLQVGEVMYSNENITLSWDATSIDGS